MWTAILWPLAVVLLEACLFVLTLVLARIFTRSHDQEWGDLEQPGQRISARSALTPEPIDQRLRPTA